MDVAYPDTVVGTDSHTTMVNGLSVLGWGVGGIEAEAGHARPADVDDAAGSDRLQAHRQAQGRPHRDRPRAHRRRRCCARAAWSASSSSSSAPASRICRSPTAPRSATWRRNMARPAASRRSTTTPSPISSDTGRPAERGRAGRGLRQGAGHVPHQDHAGPDVHRHAQARSRHRRAVARRPEAPAGPRRAQGREGGLRRLDGEGIQQGRRDEQARAGRRPQARSRPWRRGDRGHHLLHQHVEPERDDRRRPAGAQGARPRASPPSRG